MTTKNVNCNELKWKFMEIIQQSRIRALAFTFGLCTLVIEWNISLFTNCAKMQTRKIEKQPKYGEFPTTGTSQIAWSYIQIMHHSWIKHSYTYIYRCLFPLYFSHLFNVATKNSNYILARNFFYCLLRKKLSHFDFGISMCFSSYSCWYFL